jgi:type VI secretion system secreted protein VgrG
MGGGGKAAGMQKLPDSRIKLFDQQVRAMNELSNEPIASLPYELTTAEGDVHYGLTDNEGKTLRVGTTQPQKIKVIWGKLAPRTNQGEIT